MLYVYICMYVCIIIYVLKLMSTLFFIDCLHKKIFSDEIDGQSLNWNRLQGTADDFKVMKMTKQNTIFDSFWSDIILPINLLTL